MFPLPNDLDWIAWIKALAEFGWGAYFLLAVLVAVEGPLISLVGGLAASTGYFSLPLVFIATVGGNFTADTLFYMVGYFGNLEWFARYGKWFGVRLSHLEKLKTLMNAHAPRLLFISKLTLGLMIPMLIATGLARVPWRKCVPPLVIAETLWSGALILAGYFFGHLIRQFEQGVQIVAVVSSLIVLVLILNFLAHQWRKLSEDPVAE